MTSRCFGRRDHLQRVVASTRAARGSQSRDHEVLYVVSRGPGDRTGLFPREVLVRASPLPTATWDRRGAPATLPVCLDPTSLPSSKDERPRPIRRAHAAARLLPRRRAWQSRLAAAPGLRSSRRVRKGAAAGTLMWRPRPGQETGWVAVLLQEAGPRATTRRRSTRVARWRAPLAPLTSRLSPQRTLSWGGPTRPSALVSLRRWACQQSANKGGQGIATRRAFSPRWLDPSGRRQPIRLSAS